MARPTPEQRRFLRDHSIPMSRLFDASGLSRRQYQPQMVELEMLVAIGVAPCREAGHTLRTPAGHCAQCNPHTLAFLRRHYEVGDVYVAFSAIESLVKIGTAKSAVARLRTLNGLGYGGVRDWQLCSYVSCDRAGQVEFKAHCALDSYRVQKSYIKEGRTVECQELFGCTVDVAEAAVGAASRTALKA